jgi:phage gp36-like protein
MAYIDKNYILSRTDEAVITNILDNGSGVIDDAKLNLHLTDASAFVDSKLSNKYAIPITPVPDELKRLVLDISIYFIYSTKYTDDELESLTYRYKQALQMLDNIATGYQNLVGVELKESEISGTMVVATGRQRKYTEEFFQGFM